MFKKKKIEKFDFKVGDFIKLAGENNRTGDASYMDAVLEIKIIDLPQIVVQVHRKDAIRYYGETTWVLIVQEYNFTTASKEYVEYHLNNSNMALNVCKKAEKPVNKSKSKTKKGVK